MSTTRTQYQITSSTTIAVHSTVPQRESKAPALIFLHFWGGSSRTFSKVIKHLSSTYKTFAIDFRGWGASTGPAEPTSYSISQLADDVQTVITMLPIGDFVVVGHSMGGKVAQLLATRGVQCLKGLVLVAPAPAGALVLPEDMREGQVHAYDNEITAERAVRGVLSANLSDDDVKKLVEDIQLGNEGAKHAWPAYGMAEDYSKEISKIRVPVRVVAGALDKVETVERLRGEVVEKIAGATLIIVQDSGHMLPMESPMSLSKNIDSFCSAL